MELIDMELIKEELTLLQMVEFCKVMIPNIGFINTGIASISPTSSVANTYVTVWPMWG